MTDRVYSNYLCEISNNYPQSKHIQFMKKTEWILPHLVKRTSISEALTFYTDANKIGMISYTA